MSPTKLEGNLDGGAKVLPNPLSICVFFTTTEKFITPVSLLLGSDRYAVTLTNSSVKFLTFIEQEANIDCLLMYQCPELPSVLSILHDKATLLPAVIVRNEKENTIQYREELENNRLPPKSFLYHEAEVELVSSKQDSLEEEIEKAIAGFINLSPTSDSKNSEAKVPQKGNKGDREELSLQSHQERLADKLRERLGYLGVYYKRNPQNFLRNMPPGERQKFLEQLKARYRQIVLSYFAQNNNLNHQIDEFVNISFFSDVPVTKIVEIHMDLMDEFSTQLKLEGRQEDLLLDYRLTLIDTMAHLCEMYRRSIPKDS
ncbi:MAG: circadian clock protein KaiA [Cyanobacteriota bacterium]|nr:circadian clock protein KaiA [Cyanobacteriota bacterium]